MANPDSVSQNTAANFGNYAIAGTTAASLAATGNAVVALPILSGGLTAGTGTFQDVAISGGNVIVSGYNSQALFLKVNTNVAGTIDIRVYGDTVNF